MISMTWTLSVMARIVPGAGGGAVIVVTTAVFLTGFFPTGFFAGGFLTGGGGATSCVHEAPRSTELNMPTFVPTNILLGSAGFCLTVNTLTRATSSPRACVQVEPLLLLMKK